LGLSGSNTNPYTKIHKLPLEIFTKKLGLEIDANCLLVSKIESLILTEKDSVQ